MHVGLVKDLLSPDGNSMTSRDKVVLICQPKTRGPVSNFDRIEFLVAVIWCSFCFVSPELLFHKLQEFRAWIETSIVLQPLWRLFFYVRRPRRRLSSWTATFGWWPTVEKEEVVIEWEGK